MDNDKERTGFAAFMTKVYGIMGFGVLVTAIISLLVTMSPGHFGLIDITTTYVGGEAVRQMSLSWFFWVAIFVELGLVLVISLGSRAFPAGVTWVLFMVYAALNGVTLTPLLMVYTGESVFLAFFMAVVVFTVAAVYGHRTKKDLTKLGGILMVALISLIIAMVINIFIGSSLMAMGISAIAVILFTILTAYDVQALRALYASEKEGKRGGLAVLGALTMYLNMINLFIHILRLIGTKND